MFICSHDAVVYYKEGGLINQKEFDFLTKFYESAKKTITEPVNLIIWVDTDPVKCLARIEDKKTFDYDYSLEQLQMLDKIYKNWLNGDVGVKVVRIDGNLPEEELKSMAVEIAIATRRQYTDKL